MKLLLIRHGQTEWNKLQLLQGIHDTELSAEGMEQAKAAALSLKDTHIDVAFASPLKRTRITCGLLLEGRDVPVFYDDRFRERIFGEAEGRPIAELDLSETWTFGAKPKYEGMESTDEFYGRVAAGLDDIYASYPDSTVLLVTHGGVSVAVGYYFLGPPKSGSRKEYYLPNCVVREYEK